MRLYFVLRFLRVKFILSFFLIISCIITLSKLFTQRTDLKKVKPSKENFWKSPVSQNKRMGLHHPSASARSFRKFVPGQFLKGITPVEKSYCNFKYGSDFVNWTDNISYSPELGNEGPYRVIYNVIEVNYKFENMSEFAVTYCTHATPEFLYHIVEIVKRWDSFVSVAVFVPGEDALISLIIIKHICRCFQEMSRISLHLVFPAMHPPNFVSNSYNTVNNYSSQLFKDCSGPDTLLNGSFTTYKRQRNLIYPVNVARNVARMGAKTKYILVSDVELLPSKNLVQEFLAMIERLQQRNIVLNPTVSSQETRFKNLVFVLPVFEVESNVLDVPQTKYDLLRLYTKNRAVYFHRWVCLHCQRFPGLQRWLQRTQEIPKIIKPFLVARREFPYHRWEPIYIGTNHEPLYSELLSWEGQQDKMTQMNEMCLMGYRFIILDGAFLVHTPGMKRKSELSANETAWRKMYERKNIQVYNNIAVQMTQKYKENARCKV